jgi:exodeoxyribonuclease V beta subunit
MDNAPTQLDPLRFPLTGSHLIEASAGTGKTFTIALLYVRLILGHGQAQAFSAGALTPPQLLVVTFTEAATQELRDRIRARLSEAAARFRADPAHCARPPAPATADLLDQLRDEYPPADWPACARKLELAAEWMDEAAVSTIHAWCNRMLREHAFDSHSLFRLELDTDPTELRLEITRDYWRKFFYPLNQDAIQQIRQCWPSPDELAAASQHLLCYADRLDAAQEPGQIMADHLAKKQQQLAALKQPWPQWVEELRDLFDLACKNKQVHGQKLSSRHYEGWLDQLQQWATSDDDQLTLTDAAWHRLSADGIREAWKTGAPPDHPAFRAIAQLRIELQNFAVPQNELLSHAVRWIAATFAQTQAQRAKIGFDELLTRLETALDGAHGARLAEIIRRQFPVALIDEFQDTDPVQYRIFARIYHIQANRQDSALILIGDPKQAIYAFRGADIYTYLQARAAVAGRCYTLVTNYRSTRGMVDAVNHCFAQAEQRASSHGAFRFRNEQGNPVPFHSVHAHGRQDNFRVDDQVPAALTCAFISHDDDEPCSKTTYIEQMAPRCASQIVAWLELGAQGRAGFGSAHGTGDTGDTLRPLRPADIAVLVNNSTEARAIRTALAQRKVRSVYLSDKDTVYATPQAREIQHWLAACAAPDDGKLLRAALSTLSLGLSYAELDQLNTDEDAWESRVIQFKAYREIWQRQGVLPMLRRILADFGCARRCLERSDDLAGLSGERILTDLLHLAELLQQASFTLEGEHALIRHLAEQIAAPTGSADSIQQRLESDAERVQVITIHKSKGLEYPLVFLPFICATRPVKKGDAPIKWHDDQLELQIALHADQDSLARADEERLGEDLRKVYVALTRARYLTWLGLAPINTEEPSAIGHLFGLSNKALRPHALEQFAQTIATPADICIVPHTPVTTQHYTGTSSSAPEAPACRPLRPPAKPWWISSYSALRIAEHATPAKMPGADTDTPQAANLIENLQDSEPGPLAGPMIGPLSSPAAHKSMHRFHKGPEAGTFLHELLEWMADTGFTTLHANTATTGNDTDARLRDLIARRCRVRHWEGWVEPLHQWMHRMLNTPLPLGIDDTGSHHCRLGELQTIKAEMEFCFETCDTDLARLDQAVRSHTLAQRPRPALATTTINGMLKGFIDLVFEHEGRYYVADYKSNWLGPTDEDYTQDAMDAAIRAHRYDLQYVIYLFALHRLLKSRLPDYDYERHVGGALYLFVRGIGAATAGVHFERPPRVLMEQLEAMFTGNARRAA